MKNNTKLIFLIFFVTIILFSSTLLVTAQETITIKFGMSNPLDPLISNEAAFCRVFKEYMESLTNNRIQVELFPSQTLGKAEEMWKLVQRGTIQMTFSGMGILAQFYPLASVQSVFFLFPSLTVGAKVYAGDFGKELTEDIFEKTGVRVVAYPIMGFNAIVNNAKPVHSPEDLKGLRIRSMSIPIQLESFEALGAKSITIDWGETYSALQTGVADGMHGHLPGLFAGKIYEVTDYLTFSNHLMQAQYVVANDEWLKSLSESDRTIFWDAVRISLDASHGACRICDVLEESGMPFLKKAYKEVYKPSEEEMEKFRALAIPAGEKYIEEALGEEGIRWLDKLKNAIKIAEEELKQGDIW